MTVLPEYLTEQTEEAIRRRMMDRLPSDLDKTEGGYIWDALSPASIELALAAIRAQEVLRRGFAGTTFGAYLDLRCQEHGVTRKPAVKAAGEARFTGTAGTLVPAGTRVVTPADPATGTASVEFVTTAAAVLSAAGQASVGIEAVEAGAKGNVPAGAIRIFATPVTGVTAVTNAAATTGGMDQENDASLLERYLQRVRSPSAGGNKADYMNWALEVPGVGGASVVPVKDGPGTVSVAIISASKDPAGQELIDAVQHYIAPSWISEFEAEAMTIGGYGVSVDDTQSDDTAGSLKMAYHASGPGTVTHALHPWLPQPGIWQARVKVKAGSVVGSANLLQVGVWNVSAAGWAKTRPSGSASAVRTLRAADLSVDFSQLIQEFYWNGQDQLELRVSRLGTDTSTTVWLDRVVYRSTFGKDTGEGKAPVGARVTVSQAAAVLINVTATLTIEAGYSAAGVISAVTEHLRSYIRSLAFQDDNDVRYVRVGQTILDTPGVRDYTGFKVNGGDTNVSVGTQEVAVLGTVTLTS